MKSKDTQLLEEAYTKINKINKINEMYNEPVPGIDPETERMYWAAFEKVKSGEISTQQWGDICAKLLGDIMNAHWKAPEREISAEEDEQMIAADLEK